jgi:hypothetical protein
MPPRDVHNPNANRKLSATIRAFNSSGHFR